MQFTLAQYSKQISVAFLLAMWFLMDMLKIDDLNLRYAIMGLIASITGWHVLNNLPGKTVPVAPAPMIAPTLSTVTITQPVTPGAQ